MSVAKKIASILVVLTIFTVQAHAFQDSANQSKQASAPVARDNFTKGTVIETMNAAGYTYLHLDNGSQKRWAAIPASQVKVGDEVEIAAGMEMNNFPSKSLGRTFKSIIFSQGLVQR